MSYQVQAGSEVGGSVDPRVKQALQLLQAAGRLDLLADGVGRRARSARQAASGVAAAVTAYSPPRGKRRRALPQVRRMGLGWGQGGCADAATQQHAGQIVGRLRRLSLTRHRQQGAGRRRPASSGCTRTAAVPIRGVAAWNTRCKRWWSKGQRAGHQQDTEHGPRARHGLRGLGGCYRHSPAPEEEGQGEPTGCDGETEGRH
ncbi:hypothetical protein NDU88_000319 [Pleurodeles waltl]|uniref:Uncharacterized protein n=1 Tax=Pleurodeles waltl TaxID=8319 RepID=A0AAV7S896_PLEWA|nr:hypothetical protein NDU88_000319 [Pleurodeles waltl]